MKVFISWSGDLSNKIAEVLREWLPGVLQAVKPFFTPNDIEKGARWASDIASELNNSQIGLFIITPDNMEKPWIMFEAGAISRQIDASRICVLMFEIESTDLKGPLTQFQATKFEKDDFRKLVRNINKNLGDNALAPNVLEDVFGMFWPKLEEKITNIIKAHKSPSKTGTLRADRDMLEEVLNIVRSVQKEVAGGPAGRVAPATKVQFAGSTYEKFIDTLDVILYGLSFDNDELDLLEPEIKSLSDFIRGKAIISMLKNPMLERIESMSSALEGERLSNSDKS